MLRLLAASSGRTAHAISDIIVINIDTDGAAALANEMIGWILGLMKYGWLALPWIDTARFTFNS